MKKILCMSIVLYLLSMCSSVFAEGVDGYYSTEYTSDAVNVYYEVTNKGNSKNNFAVYTAAYDEYDRLLTVISGRHELKPDEVVEDKATLAREGVSSVRTFLWLEDTIQPLNYVDVDSDRILWDNVAIGGGGYVTGLITHPYDEDVIYARTDVGGLYKYNPETREWKQLFDFVSHLEQNYYGIDGVALDPKDPDTLYVASGKYDYKDEHDVFRSTDGGETFEKTNFPAKFGGNQSNRAAGECIEVDPLNSNIIFVITRSEGIYKSENKGDTWQKVKGFTFESSDTYGRIIYFDKTQESGTYTKTIYAGLYNSGLYKSEDGGESWALLEGSPSKINRIDADGDKMYLATGDGLYLYADGEFKNITPGGIKNFSGVAVNKYNGLIAAITRKGSSGGTDFKNKVYISEDGGSNWTDTYSASTFSYHADWAKSSDRRISAASAMKFVGTEDAPNQLMVSDWYGVWSCDDITDSTPDWYYNLEGIEETVSLTLCCPPVGHTLFAGVADVEGMFWDNVDVYPDRYISDDESSRWQYISSMDFCEKYPNIMVRTGGSMVNNYGRAAYSFDYGNTWTEMPYLEGPSGEYAESGRICISSDIREDTGLPVLVTVAMDTKPHYSLDMGNTWNQCVGLPDSDWVPHEWTYHNVITGDRINPDYFYAFVGRDVYVSSNGGINYKKTATLEWGDPVEIRIYASPYTEGEVWVSIQEKGLFKSMDYGESFTKISQIQDSLFFGFGKNAPGRDNATVYTYAKINNVWGIYRSIDRGETFVRINTDDTQMGDSPNNIMGDRQRFGVVYITSNGRGVLYGEPLTRKNARNNTEGDPLLRRISTNTDSVTLRDLQTVGVKNVIAGIFDEYIEVIKATYDETEIILTVDELQSIVDECNAPYAIISGFYVTNSDKYDSKYNLVAESFDTDRLQYNVYLDQYVDNVDVAIVPAYEGQTVTVNGEEISGDESVHISDLKYGDNLYNIDVVSLDGATSKTYKLNINRGGRNSLIKNSSFGYGTESWKLGKTSPANGYISITENPGWMTVVRTAEGGSTWRLGLKSDTFQIPCNTTMIVEFMASTVNGELGEVDRKINVMKKVGNTSEQSAISGNGSGSVDLVNGANARYTFSSGGTDQKTLTSCYMYLQTGDSGQDEDDVKFKYVRVSYEGADGSLSQLNVNANGALANLNPEFKPDVYEYSMSTSASMVLIAPQATHGGTAITVNGKAATNLNIVNLSKGLNEVKIKGTSVTGGESEYTLFITKE